MQCQNVRRDNEMNSVMYEKNASSVPSQGTWILVASSLGGDISFTTTTSVTSTDSSKTSSQMSYSLSMQMNMGMMFGGANMTSSFSSTLVKETSHTMSQSQSVSISRSCNLVQNPSAVGLWQWQTSNSEGTYRVATSITQCRYNDLWGSMPACPPTACRISATEFQCATCQDGWRQ